MQPLEITKVPLDGTVLIEAGAGTGKTFTIEHLFLRFILERRLDVTGILVVTFTEAATKELRDRIRNRLTEAYGYVTGSCPCIGDTLLDIITSCRKNSSDDELRSLLRKAVIAFDEAAVFTIHGFCRKMLADNSFESALPFDAELLKDQAPVIQEIADDFWRTRFSTENALFGAVALKNHLGPDGLARFAGECVTRPTARLVPDRASAAPETLMDVFEHLCTTWQESREEIKQLLYNDKGLKRSEKFFREDMLDHACTHLDLLCSGTATPDSLRSLEKFTATAVGEATKKKAEPPGHAFFDLCDSFIGSEQDFILSVKLTFAEFVKRELRLRKAAGNVLSFDDLLINLRNALLAPSGVLLRQAVRRTFSAALIDEFQDTDPVQYDIFTTLFSGNSHSLFLIGDPKQSIYRFRGADIFAYMQAAEAASSKKFTLETNYRSEQPLVDAVNSLFSFPENPFVLGTTIDFQPMRTAPGSKGNEEPLLINREPGSGCVLWFLKRAVPDKKGSGPSKAEAREAALRATVAEIARLLRLADDSRACLGPRPITPADIAVLVTWNEDARRCREALSRAGIPAVVSKTGNVFTTDEADEFELLLRAVAAPGIPGRLNAALATPQIGCKGTDILEFIESDERIQEYDRHLEHFFLFNELWHSKGFIRMFRELMSTYRVRRHLLSREGGDRKLTNFLHLAELTHTASLERRLGISGVLSWLSEQRAAVHEAEEHELRLERDDAAVQIMTVHKSKGLEFPVVFCPFMWQGSAEPSGELITFHRNGEACLALSPDACDTADIDQAGRENMAELMRLLYVALTRARNRCYVTCGKIGVKGASSLDYLFGGGLADYTDDLAALQDKHKGLKEEVLFETIKDYTTSSGNSLMLCEPPQEIPERYSPHDRESETDFSFQRLSNPICTDWGIASYSLLTSGERHATAHAHPEAILRDEPVHGPGQLSEYASPGFFRFPRGTVAGSCVHSIFEQLDFSLCDTSAVKSLIDSTLATFGLRENTDTGPQNRTDAVYDMLTRVMTTPLNTDNERFSLSGIPARNRLTEMSFFYPLRRISPDDLASYSTRHGVHADPMAEQTGRLVFKPVQGYMQGFIDLVFLQNGKYYLLDWKTNHLGDHFDDYTGDNLKQCMSASHYTLQYYIYTVALHKYLAARIEDYSYADHFGGVFYLFVRGISPDHPDRGIFYDRPRPDAIAELTALLCEGI